MKIRTFSKIAIGFLSIVILNQGLALATPYKPVTENVKGYSKVKANPVYKLGIAYKINGVKYTPKEGNYDQIGMASWYGPKFNGKLTANGEIFNEDLVTAASPVLPLPSVVKVTNLENGRTLIVRVNDRGPYRSNRIIDLSKRAAELLGFQKHGTARVRVTLMPKISKLVALQMPNYKSTIKSNNGQYLAMNKSDIIIPPLKKIKINEVSDVKKVTTKAVNSPLSNENALDDNASSDLSTDPSRLKQVNLAEPTGIQQYVPRGVFVQVGAFDSNNQHIKKALTSLSKVGVVTLQNIDIKGRNMLRVRVGPYGSIADAGKIKNALEKLGYKDPRVVIEE